MDGGGIREFDVLHIVGVMSFVDGQVQEIQGVEVRTQQQHILICYVVGKPSSMIKTPCAVVGDITLILIVLLT